MIKCVPLLVLAVVMAGCSSSYDNVKLDAVIDSCYVVLKSKPRDKWDRINKYLDFHKERGVLSSRDTEIINKCLRKSEELCNER